MNRSRTGWLFVAAQAVLLITLVALPGGDAWPTPAWLHVLGMMAVIGGVGLVVVAALRLGPALTPTPIPTTAGELTTGGLYQYVRHPIYSGVLASVLGVTIRSGSWLVLAVGAATVVFFHIKARWEEQRLTEHYPDYPAYAAVTPRFLPRPGRPGPA
ncbi:MAG: isoprenylcysteine carboxylmethyltransferase family protein [Actinomycetota bacterium]